MVPHNTYFTLTVAALLLGLVVVTLGAYTRLSHAGLACPDWPGCYGSLVVPAAGADSLYPGRPLHMEKAWKEMIHRYAAGMLGVTILALAIISVQRRPDRPAQRILPVLLLGLVIFQALLGMWTVTWLLKPVVVSAHLIGGFAILSLVFWLLLDQVFTPVAEPPRALLSWAVAGLAVLAVQVFLGGWTSANYAALACPEFPACTDGRWWPETDFREAFVFWRGMGADYEGGVLDAAGRTAVHLSHRIGALVALVVIGAVALRSMRSEHRCARGLGALIGSLLCLQLALGIGNVLLRIPMSLALAHHATAALLLLALVSLLHLSVSRPRPQEKMT